jgi:uncharacterized protein YbjT (DUF2867 family)
MDHTQRKTTLVIGGTGKTGRRVADRLAGRGFSVRIGSRSGDPAFDWEDPQTWAPAVENIDRAYISYYPDLAFKGAAEKVKSFAGVAVDQGVQRLVLLSGRNEPGAQLAEVAVQESGAEWTLVRSSVFAQNFSEGFWRDAVVQGEIAVPAGDVAEPFVDAEDIADVAFAALTEDKHVGRLYELTGPRLLTFAEVAAEIAHASGRDVRYLPVTTDQFATALTREGLPADYVIELTDLFGQILDGRNAYLSDGVRRALRREPRDFTDFARNAAAWGAWGRVEATT